ncbi:flavin reductase family protein [uncultured Friedmanniella sp.]|uniref:flavin reductase family protein n=1 Tax=uncultured Friedmanniella sp. TaxID=335381 RepID=UPI0035CC0A9F
MTSPLTSNHPALGEDDAAITPEEFRSVFRRHPAGVAVITGWSGDRPFGFSATSVISVSAAPPVVAFSVQASSSSWPGLAAADSVVISLLSAAQADLSARFATRGIDRFAAGGWHRLPSGEPVVTGAASWLRGTVVERIPVGGSYLVAVRVVATGGAEQTDPLVYLDHAYHRLDESTAL